MRTEQLMFSWFGLTNRIVRFLLIVLCLPGLGRECQALGQTRYVETVYRPGSFTIARGQILAPFYVDSNDYAGIVRAATDLISAYSCMIHTIRSHRFE
jgi:hypothetical protein